ncbi:MAG: hypothetical protein IJ679_12450, partial [Lachnospiraceae bacterium]|nr:hypothetical protein [Lachnospiraceae bacterium]
MEKKWQLKKRNPSERERSLGGYLLAWEVAFVVIMVSVVIIATLFLEKGAMEGVLNSRLHKRMSELRMALVLKAKR